MAYAYIHSFPPHNVLFKYLGLCIINVVAAIICIDVAIFSCVFFLSLSISRENQVEIGREFISNEAKRNRNFMEIFHDHYRVADLAEILLKSSSEKRKIHVCWM